MDISILTELTEKQITNNQKYIGQVFYRLTVLGFAGTCYVKSSRNYQIVAKCKCECGVCKVVMLKLLKSQQSKSCGCLQREKVLEKNTTHGKYGSSLHTIWRGMIDRCRNSSHVSYKNYGGKGVMVCADWKNFENFEKWSISNGYEDKLTIDRIDSCGNYEPENCRYVTSAVNGRNRSVSLKCILDGEKLSLMECSKILNVSYSYLHSIKTGRNKNNFSSRLEFIPNDKSN